MIKFRWPLLAILTLLGGCMNLAPQYERPEAPVAEQWLPAASTPKGQVSADIEWQSFFTDSRLARLQSLALSNNRDLRLAVLNVEKAQAQYRIQRAESLPSIDASVSGTHSRTPGSLSNTGSAATTHDYSAQLGLSSYEVDLFGRVQNLQDEALEDYLALTETRRSTQISLVAEVATAWLTLAADNERLHLAQETLRSQQATYELTQRSHALGGSSGLSVAQAQTTVESERVDAAAYESQILQDRNALRLLVGSDIPEELLPGAYLESGRGAGAGAGRAAFQPVATTPRCAGRRAYAQVGQYRHRRRPCGVLSQHQPDGQCRLLKLGPVRPVQVRQWRLDICPEHQPADLRCRQ